MVYQALKLFRAKFGLTLTSLFLFATCSMMSGSRKSVEVKYPEKTLQYDGGRQTFQFEERPGMWHSTHTTICFYINTEHTEVVAHENALFKVTLFITYGRDAGTNRFAPIQETTSFFGWSLGYEWKPFGPTVQIRGNDLSCTANGILEWKLLNNTVYSQFKSFSRTIELAE